jgi:uncharacterized membrane protein YvbJ
MEKSETISHVTHLNETIEMIEKDVEKKSITGASGAITKWITTLTKYDELKPISTKLEKLKEAIADKDGEKIAELMTSLGEVTTKAAEEAKGDDAKKIKMLGKCLVTAAKAISKFA